MTFICIYFFSFSSFGSKLWNVFYLMPFVSVHCCLSISSNWFRNSLIVPLLLLHQSSPGALLLLLLKIFLVLVVFQRNSSLLLDMCYTFWESQYVTKYFPLSFLSFLSPHCLSLYFLYCHFKLFSITLCDIYQALQFDSCLAPILTWWMLVPSWPMFYIFWVLIENMIKL